MRDYIDIGSAPSGEDCAQVGAEDYHSRVRVECNRFIGLIRKTLGPEPEGARLSVKAFSHDFGTYHEVVCYFDDNSEEAMRYAFRCQDEAPTRWEQDELPAIPATPTLKDRLTAGVCDSCTSAAHEMVDEGMDGVAELLMLELGADVEDHLCDEVETAGQILCGCACRNGRTP